MILLPLWSIHVRYQGNDGAPRSRTFPVVAATHAEARQRYANYLARYASDDRLISALPVPTEGTERSICIDPQRLRLAQLAGRGDL